MLAWPLGEGSAAANFRLGLNDVPIQQVNELMEAIHEAPAMLMNWDFHDLDELQTHLDCFRTLHWRQWTDESVVDIPDLVQCFAQRLSELESQT